jgi:cardiolipin hydrolase
MLRTCKKTLDIAIFTLTNDKISAAINEAFERGVEVRIIADDDCCKMMGSDVFRLALNGIKVKTDDARFHMHHKFAVLDHSVVITGSFNWTSQAVKFNQENIIFYENKALAASYTEEYNRLWDTFHVSISKKDAEQKIKEEDEKKKEWAEKRKKGKEAAGK